MTGPGSESKPGRIIEVPDLNHLHRGRYSSSLRCPMMKNMKNEKADPMHEKKPGPVVFGEVLFDIFPGGNQVLGGAPFNVAWHLQGFGARPLMISAVGDDDLGSSILQRMQAWGMDTSGIQVDREHPTGRVMVSMDNGDPSYEIVRDSAWDFINPQAALSAMESRPVSMLYHGSLAARSPASRTALESLRNQTETPVFIDVNLRPPDWNHELIDSLLSGTTWIKLNRSELAEVGGDGSSPERAAQELLVRFGAQWVITTMGEKGAAITAASFETLEQPPPAIEDLVDTVGAGDAFSALVIHGLSSGWSPEVILERAAEFAADICRIQGATSYNPELYAQRLKEWENKGA